MAERLIGMLIFPRAHATRHDRALRGAGAIAEHQGAPDRASMAPVKTDRGMEIVPTITLAECPKLDLVMVRAGPASRT